jgi:DNA-directed RNA polymerase subunit RPC12/RpoP
MAFLFDDVSLSTLKTLTVEELLIKIIEIIDILDLKPLPEYGNDISSMKRDISLIKDKIKGDLQHLQLYLCESYRRDINNHSYHLFKIINDFLDYKCFFCNEKKIEYHINDNGRLSDSICSPCNSKYVGKNINLRDIHCQYLSSKILCDDDLTSKQRIMYERLRGIKSYGSIFKDKLQEIQIVKETMIRIMKTPLLTKELEDCMDEILDLNGNKISQLKDYLTDEQYRFIRSGAKFVESEEQQDMFNRMNKMLYELKRCSIGQSILEPIARPITPEIKYLKRELESHKKSQKNHENDLEKLKTKL